MTHFKITTYGIRPMKVFPLLHVNNISYIRDTCIPYTCVHITTLLCIHIVKKRNVLSE